MPKKTGLFLVLDEISSKPESSYLNDNFKIRLGEYKKEKLHKIEFDFTQNPEADSETKTLYLSFGMHRHTSSFFAVKIETKPNAKISFIEVFKGTPDSVPEIPERTLAFRCLDQTQNFQELNTIALSLARANFKIKLNGKKILTAKKEFLPEEIGFVGFAQNGNFFWIKHVAFFNSEGTTFFLEDFKSPSRIVFPKISTTSEPSLLNRIF